MGEQKAITYTQKALYYEELLLQALQVQFNRQLNKILMNLNRVERSVGVKTKDYVTDLLDWEEADSDMQKATLPHILQIIIETGQKAMLDLGLDPGMYDPYTEAIQAFMEARSIKLASDINDETEKQLRATLTEAINAGESTFQMRARIELVMGTATIMRADLISRTEVARAQSAGDIYAWTQSGVVDGKEWYTAMDERVCKFCGPMNGRIIGLEENFFNKGDLQVETTTNKKGEERQVTYNHSYDDVPGAPLHPKCRCTLLPVRL